jgi:hypothetical protein
MTSASNTGYPKSRLPRLWIAGDSSTDQVARIAPLSPHETNFRNGGLWQGIRLSCRGPCAKGLWIKQAVGTTASTIGAPRPFWKFLSAFAMEAAKTRFTLFQLHGLAPRSAASSLVR